MIQESILYSKESIHVHGSLAKIAKMNRFTALGSQNQLGTSNLSEFINFTSAIKNCALIAQVISEPSTCLLVYLYGLLLVRLRAAKI